MKRTEELHKLVKLTGDRAKLDAKANDTYIVYKKTNGELVREFNNGNIIPVPEQDSSHD